MFQERNNTRFNRYPGLFKSAQTRIMQKYGPSMNGRRLKILSYGCSEGMELATLRIYFPDAQLYGCDINASMLEQAKTLLKREGDVTLFPSSGEALHAFGTFDIVFAMSVFCRYPDSRSVHNMQELFPFEKFEASVLDIWANLQVGGLLVMYNSSYFFSSLGKKVQFRTVRSPEIYSSGFVDHFGPDGKRLTIDRRWGKCRGHELADAAAVDPDSFIDCIFEKASDLPGDREPIQLPPDRCVPLEGSELVRIQVNADVEPEENQAATYPYLKTEIRASDEYGLFSREEWIRVFPGRSDLPLGPRYVLLPEKARLDPTAAREQRKARKRSRDGDGAATAGQPRDQA